MIPLRRRRWLSLNLFNINIDWSENLDGKHPDHLQVFNELDDKDYAFLSPDTTIISDKDDLGKMKNVFGTQRNYGYLLEILADMNYAWNLCDESIETQSNVFVLRTLT